MPISVPASPKVFTTKYANFRGVDYTNDASNVWYRRSPTGVNMLPDLSGHPYKRYGWKIEFTSADFCAAANISPAVDVTQYKVDYFELGGKEYLFFHTSLGCFYYADALTFINKSYEYDEVYYYSKSQTYNEGDFCEYTSGGRTHRYKCTQTGGITVPEAFTSAHWTEVDEDDCWKSFPPTGVSVDYRKAFFFEGGGQAAYYLFAGSKMYYFDGTRLNEAHPHIPRVLILCDPSGAGELLEEINMAQISWQDSGSGTFRILIFLLPLPMEKPSLQPERNGTGHRQRWIRRRRNGMPRTVPTVRKRAVWMSGKHFAAHSSTRLTRMPSFCNLTI